MNGPGSYVALPLVAMGPFKVLLNEPEGIPAHQLGESHLTIFSIFR